jgi:hypothetical protein
LTPQQLAFVHKEVGRIAVLEHGSVLRNGISRGLGMHPKSRAQYSRGDQHAPKKRALFKGKNNQLQNATPKI